MLLAAGVFAAAGAAAFFAGVVDWGACLEETSEACDRKELAQLQFGVALAGLVPALVLAAALVARSRRLALAMLIVAVATYLAWAILADAAHHGWDDLKFFPFLR